jgi:hypothetical protein
MTEPWITDAQTEVEPSKAIQDAMERRRKLTETITFLEGNLKDSKASLRRIDLFDTMNVSEVRDAITGKRLKLEQVITASLANADVRARAVHWLRDHSLDDLIERTIVTSFHKGEDEEANHALDLLLKQGYRVADEEQVNTASFKAAVKELMEQGEIIPADDIGVFVVRKVVVRN